MPRLLLVVAAFVVVAAGIRGVVLARTSTLGVDRARLRISTVTQGLFHEYVPVVGSTAPLVTHYLDASEGGRVEEIYREAGSLVEQGDRILTLANTTLLLDVMYREAELFQQSNNLRSTKLAMEQHRLQMQRQVLEIRREIARQNRLSSNATHLLEKGLVSRQEHEQALEELGYLVEQRELLLATQNQEQRLREEQIKQLEESLQRMQENLQVVKRHLDSLVIRAPIAGRLTALNAEVGQAKNRGQRLGQVDVLSGFKLRATIDEHYISRVSSGLTGTFSYTGNTYLLRVDKVYPQVIEGRFEVDFVFDGTPPEDLRRGQTFHLRLMLSDPAQALLLPVGDFFQSTGGRWVYVLDSDGKEARRRQVTVGRRNSDCFEVLTGLRPGERVITSGYEPFADTERLVLRGKPHPTENPSS
ncbi:MAG: HlyD family efflux transporter periplasmic adaptor subunit [Thermoanaerobaculales bacterium]|nr:HlyD family efflux transporter periplasmic adaptor subunit [Thermoanaerobaculales bacterium]